MKTILALDTAAEVLSAALSDGDRYWYREAGAGLTHSELLPDLMDGLLRDAGLGPEALEAAACMKGPGSFTGLRIGFSAAKGLALALGIPFIACSTLDCAAYPWTPWPGLVLPLLDAKKGRFFSALYAGGRRVSAEMDADPESLAACIRSQDRQNPEGGRSAVLLTGSGASLFLSRVRAEGGEGRAWPEDLLDRLRLDPLYKKGRALELAAVAKKQAIINNEGDDMSSAPEYLRKSDADLNL
ncbi:MAG: tRNA (adenosine(37)-N6)-threonylcarbamoyltransferase complex dimerization subunit type 1 TsaB [Treponema sp.]|nr:tRNA (adenosine(37)-N6)-threonylcarbamoyltransferase complex dimerization subunit type 1 TsaB [Treponema sp.]